MRALLAVLLTCLAAVPAAVSQSSVSILTPTATAPQSGGGSGIDARRFDAIEPLVREAIAEKKLPGAVILVGRGDRTLYHKAFGNRAVSPATESMTNDTIFDLASLTKVVATTTSVMILLEQGKVRLNDRVASFVPGFERYGKGDITIRHLLTHVSGLRPDVDLTHALQLAAVLEDEEIARKLALRK